MPDATQTVNLTIDGVPIGAPAGTNLIEAARQHGIEIPFYCYHPRLTIAANCRMCLVETASSPKLVPACQTPVTEGMKVETRSARVKEAQRSVLEFILLNHPVDCSICDQAGECKLQDYYMKYDHQPSRLTGAKKVMKEKRRVLGPLVVLDQERCILCTRCVRFMREVAKEPQLGVFGRGSHEVIDTFPGQPLTSNYAGNTIDICPVGALLSRDFRFKARAFFLTTTPSVCTGCSRGCSTFLDFFDDTAYRYRPRENKAVNDCWMCDHGRLSYRELVTDRALAARTGLRAASREEALREVATQLRSRRGSGKLALAISPNCSLEAMLAAAFLAREALSLEELYVTGRPEGAADHLLLRSDRNANRKGLEWIASAFGLKLRSYTELVERARGGGLDALHAIGAELPLALRDDELSRALADLRLGWLSVQAANETPLARAAQVLLPAATHAEEHGSFVNFEGVIQRFVGAYRPKGASAPHWKLLVELARELGHPLPVPTKGAQELFAALSPRVPELASFQWNAVPRYLKADRAKWAMAAAADGRPAGYRERSLE